MRPLFIAALLLLAACQSTPLVPQADIPYAGTPYALNVASITVVEDYVSPKRLPNVEQLADVRPDDAMREWVKNRLVAAGKQYTLEVDIVDASVIRKDLLKQKTGIEGWFTKEQTEQYDGNLQVTLKIYGNRILPVAHAEASAHQTLTLREDATLADRKALYHEMTANLIRAISLELDKNIRQYFSRYLL